MFTCMSCARSSGSTNRVVAHAPFVPGIGRGATSWSRVTNDADLVPFERLVGLADPVEARELVALVRDRPVGARRDVGVAARREHVPLPLELERELAGRDEHDALDPLLALGPVGAAAGRDLDDELRERRGEPGDRPREDPRPGAGEPRQVARDDVAQHALGNHRVRLGHDRAVGEQFASARAARRAGCSSSCRLLGDAAGARARRGVGSSMPVAAATSSVEMAPQRTPRSTNPASARTVAGSSSTAPVVRVDGTSRRRSRCLGPALAVEGVGGEVPGDELVRVQVPALEEPALERPAHEPRVQPPRVGGAPRRRAGCCVDPSERRMPVPATASCMMPFARSAAGCSIDWYCAAMPSAAL